jgi:hypothetical protein
MFAVTTESVSTVQAHLKSMEALNPGAPRQSLTTALKECMTPT